MAKRTDLLGLGTGLTDWLLPVLVAAMSFLAALALAGTLASAMLAAQWRQDTASALTVQVTDPQVLDTAHMQSRGVGQQPFFLGVAVEAGHRAQPAGDRRPGPAPTLKPPGELLDVNPPCPEPVQVVISLGEIFILRFLRF